MWLLPWLSGFLILTVAGERLELARVVVLDYRIEGLAQLAAAGLLVGAVASLLWPSVGYPVFGAAVLGLVAWLAVAGGLWLIARHVVDGPGYDVVVHAVFLGFVLSMVLPTHR